MCKTCVDIWLILNWTSNYYLWMSIEWLVVLYYFELNWVTIRISKLIPNLHLESEGVEFASKTTPALSSYNNNASHLRPSFLRGLSHFGFLSNFPTPHCTGAKKSALTVVVAPLKEQLAPVFKCQETKNCFILALLRVTSLVGLFSLPGWQKISGSIAGGSLSMRYLAQISPTLTPTASRRAL